VAVTPEARFLVFLFILFFIATPLVVRLLDSRD